MAVVINLLPNTVGDVALSDFKVETQPSYTYKLDIDKNRIRGTTDKAEAMTQTVYLILNTERYQYPIYSRNYGVELFDLIGKSRDFVMSELKRRITEALTQDDRIESVDEWSFSHTYKTVVASFVVHTIYGNVEITKEVAV